MLKILCRRRKGNTPVDLQTRSSGKSFTEGEPGKFRDSGVDESTGHSIVRDHHRHVPGEGRLDGNPEENLENAGSFAWTYSFPVLDAASLRPCHLFSDYSVINTDLFNLVRHSYSGQSNRSVGSLDFFNEVDKQMAELDKRGNHTPLPITLIRHPGLFHSHPHMARRKSLRRLSELISEFLDMTETMAPIFNPWHREVRVLIKSLLYLIGTLDQAASHGDISISVECLDLADNVVTSLRGLCELEYAVREHAYKARGF